MVLIEEQQPTTCFNIVYYYLTNIKQTIQNLAVSSCSLCFSLSPPFTNLLLMSTPLSCDCATDLVMERLLQVLDSESNKGKIDSFLWSSIYMPILTGSSRSHLPSWSLIADASVHNNIVVDTKYFKKHCHLRLRKLMLKTILDHTTAPRLHHHATANAHRKFYMTEWRVDGEHLCANRRRIISSR